MQSKCFLPVARSDSRVLVLGTLPSQVSLQRGEYYAHPSNRFWDIMGRLCGFTRSLSYEQRLDVLVKRGIALWDVCATARRPGSSDAAIRDVVANDFVGFFKSHPRIELICFNGSKAENLFHRRVLAELPPKAQNVQRHRLPSTSPAHAGMPFEEKFAAWSIVLHGSVIR